MRNAATVTSIDTPRRDLKARPRDLEAAFHEAYDDLHERIKTQCNPLTSRSQAVYLVARRWVEYWQRQAAKHERILVEVLASDATPDDLRNRILRGIGIATQRDAKLLHPAEAELIAAYRALSQTHRSVVRQVFLWAEDASRTADLLRDC